MNSDLRQALSQLKTDKSALVRALESAGAKCSPDLSHIPCPFHAGGLDEGSGSLSVFLDNQDNGWRWRCHKCDAGGDVVDVVARVEKLNNGDAIRRTLELNGIPVPKFSNHAPRPMPTAESTADVKEKPVAPQRSGKRTFPDLDTAAAFFEQQTGGTCVRRDCYMDAQGHESMAVLRLDSGDGKKSFRPLHRQPDGWAIGDPSGPLPLFHLDQLAALPQVPVVVCEGEKCATVLQEAGVLAVTSAHGAKSAAKTDWTPLAGRNVTLWPDNDEPGRGYRDTVTGILQNLTPPAEVRWLDPRRLTETEGWDAADFAEDLLAEGKTDEEVSASVSSALDLAAPAPRQWRAGVNLDDCQALARLADENTWKPKKFISTGYASLDKALGGGWAEGESTSLFAPSGMGKTTSALNLALKAAKQGVPTCFISLEMGEASIWQVATAIVADIPRQHVRRGTLVASEAERFNNARQEMSKWPLHVIDRTRFPIDPEAPEAPTMQTISQVLQEGVRICGWRLVFIDYLMKVGPFGADDLTRTPRLTNWIFDTAQRLNLHTVSLAQCGKASWGRVDADGHRSISLEDVKGTVETVADMDNAIGLVRDDWNTETPQDSPPMRAVVLKARQASGGSCKLVFHRLTGRIEEAPVEATPPAMTALPRLPVPRRRSVEEDRSILLGCVTDQGRPRDVILLDAQQHGLSKENARSLLVQVVHDHDAFEMRIRGKSYYARTREALQALLATDTPAPAENEALEASICEPAVETEGQNQ